MQVGEIIGVIFAAFILALPLMALHKAYVIGSAQLPAPQAGLMALMANGIVAGEMAWPLVIVGMFFAVGLILIKAPAPMVIAVGMYLPFESTSAIFVGGLVRWIFDTRLKKQGASDEEKQSAENVGVLMSSGFIAGESLMAVVLAIVYIAAERVPGLLFFQSFTGGAEPNFYLSLIAYPVVAFLLGWFTIKKMREGVMAQSAK
jgi:putative OPT family oligopeptide transporter